MLPKKWAVRVRNNTGAAVNVVVDGITTKLDGSFNTQVVHINEAALADNTEVDGTTVTETEAPGELNGIMKATPASAVTGTVELFLLTENDGGEVPTTINGFTLRSIAWVSSEGAIEKRTNYRYF